MVNNVCEDMNIKKIVVNPVASSKTMSDYNYLIFVNHDYGKHLVTANPQPSFCHLGTIACNLLIIVISA